MQVQLEQGWLEGEKLITCVGDIEYYSFKGIPYAAPPVGKLRFKDPQEPLPWKGVRSAKQHGPNCTQFDIFSQLIIPGSEDCLYLNVYSPNLNPTKPYAVMFYIHGGAFQSGSGDDTQFGPDFLISHDVVVVTINYRLGPLGFLCLGNKDVPGNAGLKDQVAALKWVQKNVSNFGGDPNNVTIFGQSAGGAATSLHVLSPMSKGLFKRAIIMSGVVSCQWALAFEPVQRSFQLGSSLGFETKDSKELLDFLQNAPAENIIKGNPRILVSETIGELGRFYPYTPVIERNFGQDIFLGVSPDEIINKGTANEVDILIGYTSSEMLSFLDEIEKKYTHEYKTYKELFVPKHISDLKGSKYSYELAYKIISHYFQDRTFNLETIQEFLKYINDIMFIFPTQHFLNNLVEKIENGRKYFYKFSCFSERNIYGKVNKYGLNEAAHMDDLVYLFDPKFANLQIQKSSKEYKMVNLTCTLFTNFAKYGNPTPNNSFGVN